MVFRRHECIDGIVSMAKRHYKRTLCNRTTFNVISNMPNGRQKAPVASIVAADQAWVPSSPTNQGHKARKIGYSVMKLVSWWFVLHFFSVQQTFSQKTHKKKNKWTGSIRMERSGRRIDLLGRFIERRLIAMTFSKLQTLSTKNSLKWSRDNCGVPFGKESNGVLEAI